MRSAKLQDRFDLTDEQLRQVEDKLAYLVHKEIGADGDNAREVIRRFVDRATTPQSPEEQAREFAETMREMRDVYREDADRLRQEVAARIEESVEQSPELREMLTVSRLAQDPVVANLLFEKARRGD